MIKLKKEVEQGFASTVLVGRVSTDFPGKGPIVVAAYSINQGRREAAHFSVLHDFGEYELMVAKGKYYIFAYWDKNSNLIYDVGEPAGQHGGPQLIRAPAGGVIAEIDVHISKNGGDIDAPFGFEISSEKPEKLHSRQAGALVELGDERFSEQYGVKGFWEPLSFFMELGGNIYFLEPYDPKKIPILFIHGATGTPKGWEYFVDNIDSTRFQPWFFYYPSGARIQSMSYLLDWKLSNLQRKYNFDQLYITAHSMGGLVARSYIMDYGRSSLRVKLFISLATPWGGDKMAEYGVKQSPAVIPCWIDMQPESPFIRGLYRTTMPESVDFYMFYGHRGNRNPFRSNNDGTIAMSSLLDLRPQAEAKMNYAFNEDHASIIYSREVVDQYNSIIDTYFDRNSSSSILSGGYLRLHFSYDNPSSGETPRPSLILQSNDNRRSETVISLNENSSGKIIGPFPPGNYLASLVSGVAKSQKTSQPVAIERNQTSELYYPLTPDGFVAGYVSTSIKPKDWYVGMPNKKVTPHSISLKGSGAYRTIHPVEGEEVNQSENWIKRKDHYFDGAFIFFELPPGDYELLVEAEGYHPLTRHYNVELGKTKEVVTLELTPLE